MREDFGARLRRRREEQGIALVTIAEQTKISLSLLEALERDDVSRWPTGLIRRAFVRAYAQAVGLDPNVVVAEFQTVHPDPADVAGQRPSGEGRAGGEPGTLGPPTRFRRIVESAIESLSQFGRRPVEPAPAGPRDLDSTPSAVAADVPDPGPPRSEPDLPAVAALCTQLGRVERADEFPPLLQEAASLLDAIGLIVWIWDEHAEELKPALAQGYADKVLKQLPVVGRDADNATASAFRSGQTCTIAGGDHASGGLVVPLLTPAGCAGVLAIELPSGREQSGSVRAVATILAALLAQLVGGQAVEQSALRLVAGSR